MDRFGQGGRAACGWIGKFKCKVSNIGHGKDGWMDGWVGGSLFGGVRLGVIYKEANKRQIQMNIQMKL
jgi:hypothetical protein